METKWNNVHNSGMILIFDNIFCMLKDHIATNKATMYFLFMQMYIQISKDYPLIQRISQIWPFVNLF